MMMSVDWALTLVLISAWIYKVPTLAAVVKGIHWIQMDVAAMVLPPQKKVQSLLCYTHLDENECLTGDDFCAQNCSNTVGSYTCTCNTGYTLNSDGYTCNGNQ